MSTDDIDDDRIERTEEGEVIYVHADDCGGFCDYACNGTEGDQQADAMNAKKIMSTDDIDDIHFLPKLYVQTTRSTRSLICRAVIYSADGKAHGNATCKTCPRIAANAAVSKNYGLKAASSITEIPEDFAMLIPGLSTRSRKRHVSCDYYYYQFAFNPADHEIKQP